MCVEIVIRKFPGGRRVFPSVNGRRLLPILLLAAGAGCSLFYKPPEIEFGGVAIEAFGREGASFQISVDVRNPNRYELGLDRLTYKLTVAGVEAASGSTTEPVRVPAKGSATVRVPVSLDWARLQPGGLQMLMSGRVEYAVEGEAGFTTPAGSFRRPYRRTGTIGR
jgi:hypothetical protein